MAHASLLKPSRRRLLAGSAALLVSPYVWTRPAQAAGRLMVRTPGGVFDDVKRKAVYEQGDCI